MRGEDVMDACKCMAPVSDMNALCEQKCCWKEQMSCLLSSQSNSGSPSDFYLRPNVSCTPGKLCGKYYWDTLNSDHPRGSVESGLQHVDIAFGNRSITPRHGVSITFKYASLPLYGGGPLLHPNYNSDGQTILCVQSWRTYLNNIRSCVGNRNGIN